MNFKEFKSMSLQNLFGISAALFFGLALCVPSGYSYGAVLFIFLSLIGIKKWFSGGFDTNTLWLAAVVVLMGMAWSHSFNGIATMSGSDAWAKYGLAAFCILAVSKIGFNQSFVSWGVAVGGIGALGVAVFQYLVLGMDKATGHTNAIQYGGLAMYLGIAAWTLALLGKNTNTSAWALWMGGACSVLAALLSGTRGAWIVAPLLVFFLLLWMCQFGRARLVVISVLGMSALVAAMVLPYGEKFYSRANLAVIEYQHYIENPAQAAESSIGQRLEQWRLAGAMWKEKPLFGWGIEGIVSGKKSYVDQGLAHPSVMNYGHAHNEIMDMLAKRGMLGLLILLLFYAIPLVIFWPSLSRIEKIPAEVKNKILGIRAAASLLPIAYFGFGWTQVFFAHNSGNMFYLFAIVSFWGALQYLEHGNKGD